MAVALQQLALFNPANAACEPAGLALRCPGCGRGVVLYVPARAATCTRCGRRMVPE